VDPLATGTGFKDWVELMLGTAEEDYKLLFGVSLLSSPHIIASAFALLLVPILKFFSQVLGQLVALTKNHSDNTAFLPFLRMRVY